jgi:hypothetical protein
MKEPIYAPLLIPLSSFSRVLAVLILTFPCVQRGGETSTMAHPHCEDEPFLLPSHRGNWDSDAESRIGCWSDITSVQAGIAPRLPPALGRESACFAQLTSTRVPGLLPCRRYRPFADTHASALLIA